MSFGCLDRRFTGSFYSERSFVVRARRDSCRAAINKRAVDRTHCCCLGCSRQASAPVRASIDGVAAFRPSFAGCFAGRPASPHSLRFWQEYHSPHVTSVSNSGTRCCHIPMSACIRICTEASSLNKLLISGDSVMTEDLRKGSFPSNLKQ